ncbi:CENP-C_C domain-containing protein [Trichonephila inaurata madagascariensis]|uniref:CENP-C_C domain-containing protein n=1 Tax=Trichonephila inaurata madagascariensis TaxID=2747483 RepID=A0A8X7BQM6_9ARAC|nr:CENP-C_C domain-containing protein [Trichonephila inaurata madagascariensis]
MSFLKEITPNQRNVICLVWGQPEWKGWAHALSSEPKRLRNVFRRLKITKMKGRRKPESNIDRRRSLRNRPQEEGTHELSTLLPDQMDERVADARESSPKKRPLSQKDIMSSVKKTKKIKSSEVSCSVADASKSRRRSSVASLPVIECPQKKKSLPNVNKTLNTSVKRHKKSTPKNEMYAESTKQPLNKKNREIQSPVTTVVTKEEAVRESHGDALDIRESSPFLPDPKEKRVSKRREWTSDTFSGSAKDIKRVVTRKIPRPTSVVVITTAEIPNEEGQLGIKPSDSKKNIRVSKTGTGLFQFKNQPYNNTGPETIQESIEMPEREPKKDETSKNISNNIQQNQRNYTESDSDTSTVEDYLLTHTSKYDKASRQEKSPSKPELSPVRRERSTISGQEKSPYKTTRRITPTFIKSFRQEKSPLKPEESPVPKGRPRMLKESSVEEKSPDPKGRPRMPKEASIEEKSPTKPGHSPVTKGRSTTSIEAPSKPEHSHVARGRSRISVSHLTPLNSSSVPEESSVKRKRPRETVEHFEPEESPSEPEQLPVKKRTTRIPRDFSEKKSTKVRLSKSESKNEEGPLRINPSVTKRHADSSVKRKSSMTTSDIIHQNHLDPEAFVIESSPKKITQVTGDQLNHSGQKNLSSKAKAPKNKRAAPVDNNEAQSDFGENSIRIVKRKENEMSVSGKKSHSRSEKSSKSPICHAQDKQSNDMISNGNISGPANGLRRSSRFRVPPLDTWRNERLVFEKLPSGDIQCKIDKGTEADNYGIESILRKRARKMNPSLQKTTTVTNTPVLNVKTGEIVQTVVHRPFESLQWATPNGETHKLAKTFTSESRSFGFVDVFPFSTKEKQYSPFYNLHFVVVKGHLQVTIQDTSFTFTVGDSWIVPVGVPYSITNCARARALLSFSLYKEE